MIIQIKKPSKWRYVVPKAVMFDPKLSLQARGLWAIMKGFVGPEGGIYPSQKHLLSITGLGQDTLSKYMNELISYGLIVRKQRVVNGRKSSNEYEVIENRRVAEIPGREIPATENPGDIYKKYHKVQEVPKRNNKKKGMGSKSPLSETDQIAAKLKIDPERLLLLKNHWAFIARAKRFLNIAARMVEMELVMNYELADVRKAVALMREKGWIRIDAAFDSIGAVPMYKVLEKHRNHPKFKSFVKSSLSRGAESLEVAEQFAAQHIDAMIEP